MKNGSPVKNVGYENSLVNRLRGKKRNFIVKAIRDVRNRLVKIVFFIIMKSKKKIGKEYPFFTLGSIYSTDASGLRKCLKTNDSN